MLSGISVDGTAGQVLGLLVCRSPWSVIRPQALLRQEAGERTAVVQSVLADTCSHPPSACPPMRMSVISTGDSGVVRPAVSALVLDVRMF